MKKIALLLAIFAIGLQSVFAQTREITGTVTSAEDGLSIPGVSVSVKGTTLGTITDLDGQYTLKVPQDAASLVFSFVGMQTQEVAIVGTTVNVVMESDVVGINEVVVTAMGIAREKKALGYSVSEFNSEELENVQVLDASTALQGKIAGVSISPSSGAPGASTRVIVRGISSLTGSNQPLYVIDGVPVNNEYANANSTSAATTATRTVDFGNAASDINPNDIASISVLKGAAATSLYGSRAANGVVIIKTKTGRKGKDLLVNLSSSYSLMEVARLPYYQEQFGQGWSNHFAFEENGSWGPVMNGQDRLIGNVVNNSQRIAPYQYMENSVRDFYEYGYTRDNSISLSGGSDLMGYLLSYTNAKSDGIIPGESDVLDRNSVLLKANGGTEKTKIDFSANYINKKLSAVATGQGDDAGGGKTIFQEILQNPINHYLPEYRNYLTNPFDNLDNYFNLYAQNPYWIINQNGNDYKQDRLISSININRELYEGLNISWKGGMDTYSSMYKDWGAVAKINDGAPNASANDVFGMVKEESRTVKQLDSDLILTYNGHFDLGGDDALEYNILLGNNINERTSKRHTTISKGLVVPEYYNVGNISGSAEVSTFESKRRLVGAYAQVDLSYNSLLFLQLNARNDWSSTLPKGNNSFFYPGANLGFIFTELMEENSILSFGKLRTSYAFAGNDADPYQIDPYYTTGTIRAGGYGQTLYPVGGIPAYEKGSVLGNPTLKPEISKEFEVGADLRFFNNRIGIDAAYYEKVTSDLIMTATIASSSGYLFQTANLGQISNTGFELQVNLTPVKNKNFTWDINYLFTKSNTILDELSEELGISEYIINSAYEAEFVAIPGEQLGQFRIPGYQKTPDGKIVVGDNGLPLEGDPELVGSSVPDYNMSLTNSLSYKGLRLAFLLDYQKGGYMYSYTSSITYWSGNNEQSTINDRRPWVIPNSVQQNGTDANGNPIYVENSTPITDNWHEYYSSNTNKPIESERIIEKTYFRLRELSLSYGIDESITDKLGLASATVSLYGRNLLLWTPADNSFIDPETSTYGNDLVGMFGEFAGAPSVRTYGLKLNVSF
jgi:TonB-linked SusC/RagA family outer membrane protein